MKVIVSSETKDGADLHLIPGKNFTTGMKEFRNRFTSPTSLEEDLLVVSSAIYVTDLAVRRGDAENYIRNIELTIDVVNLHAFERVKDDLLQALIVLSNDNWILNFRQRDGRPEPLQQQDEKDGVALLFSGGLDSFSAAAKFLRTGTPLYLISHVTHNRVIEDSQKALLQILDAHFGHEGERVSFRVYGRSQGALTFPSEDDRENTQRTRSFLFLALAALSARRIGIKKVLTIAENGQFAIHLPLNSARVGPFSTHTAHPEFIYHMQKMLRVLLSYEDLTIENPYVYMTKSEVVSDLGPDMCKHIARSVTCWKASRVTGLNHCGICIPCISRRIALEHLKIDLAEYKRDLFREDVGALPPDDTGKRNFIDLLEFISHFRKYNPRKKDHLLEKFWELYNEHFDQDEVINMYARFSAEAYGVLSKYAALTKLIG
jgi:7-cyano-7-deazaguanine synthase in queuosine biosynthesis